VERKPFQTQIESSFGERFIGYLTRGARANSLGSYYAYRGDKNIVGIAANEVANNVISAGLSGGVSDNAYEQIVNQVLQGAPSGQ